MQRITPILRPFLASEVASGAYSTATSRLFEGALREARRRNPFPPPASSTTLLARVSPATATETVASSSGTQEVAKRKRRVNDDGSRHMLASGAQRNAAISPFKRRRSSEERDDSEGASHTSQALADAAEARELLQKENRDLKEELEETRRKAASLQSHFQRVNLLTKDKHESEVEKLQQSTQRKVTELQESEQRLQRLLNSESRINSESDARLARELASLKQKHQEDMAQLEARHEQNVHKSFSEGIAHGRSRAAEEVNLEAQKEADAAAATEAAQNARRARGLQHHQMLQSIIIQDRYGTKKVDDAEADRVGMWTKEKCLAELSRVWAAYGDRLSSLLPHELILNAELALDIEFDAILAARIALTTLKLRDTCSIGEFVVTGWNLEVVGRLATGLSLYVDGTPLASLRASVQHLQDLLHDVYASQVQVAHEQEAQRVPSSTMGPGSFSSSTLPAPFDGGLVAEAVIVDPKPALDEFMGDEAIEEPQAPSILAIEPSPSAPVEPCTSPKVDNEATGVPAANFEVGMELDHYGYKSPRQEEPRDAAGPREAPRWVQGGTLTFVDNASRPGTFLSSSSRGASEARSILPTPAPAPPTADDASTSPAAPSSPTATQQVQGRTLTFMENTSRPGTFLSATSRRAPVAKERSLTPPPPPSSSLPAPAAASSESEPLPQSNSPVPAPQSPASTADAGMEDSDSTNEQETRASGPAPLAAPPAAPSQRPSGHGSSGSGMMRHSSSRHSSSRQESSRYGSAHSGISRNRSSRNTSSRSGPSTSTSSRHSALAARVEAMTSTQIDDFLNSLVFGGDQEVEATANQTEEDILINIVPTTAATPATTTTNDVDEDDDDWEAHMRQMARMTESQRRSHREALDASPEARLGSRETSRHEMYRERDSTRRERRERRVARDRSRSPGDRPSRFRQVVRVEPSRAGRNTRRGRRDATPVRDEPRILSVRELGSRSRSPSPLAIPLSPTPPPADILLSPSPPPADIRLSPTPPPVDIMLNPSADNTSTTTSDAPSTAFNSLSNDFLVALPEVEDDK